MEWIEIRRQDVDFKQIVTLLSLICQYDFSNWQFVLIAMFASCMTELGLLLLNQVF